MTILITGATGFLGAHVVAAAVTRGRRDATFAQPEGRPVIAVGRDVALAPRFAEPRDAGRWLAVDLLASFICDTPYENQRLGVMIPGVLRDVGDVPNLAAMVAPRELV